MWRPVSIASDIFGVCRQQELAAQTIAAKAGLSPAPVALYEQGLLVDFADGEVCEPDSLSQEEVLTLLGKVHNLCLPPFVFNLKSRCLHYWNHLPESVKSRKLKRLHNQMQNAVLPKSSFIALCHHDFGFYNLIREPGNHLKVIDWEYSSAGDACLDVVLCAVANGYDVKETVEKYCLIQGVADKKEWIERALKWLPFVQYMGLLWYLLGDMLYSGTLYKERAYAMLEQLHKG